MKLKKILMTLLMVCLFAGMASAQLKLAYVNSVQVLAEYQPYVDAKKQLEAESEKFAAELQNMTQKFQDDQKQLEQQAMMMEDSRKREKAQELQNRAMEIQQFQQDKWGENGVLAQRERELLQPVIDKVNEIIKKVGEDGNYDFIFDAVTGSLLHAKETHDITQKVIEALKTAP